MSGTNLEAHRTAGLRSNVGGDAVLAAGLTVFMTVGTYFASHQQGARRPFEVGTVVLVLLAGAALAFRRRYPVAVLAKETRVPFYVAAPVSTLDLSVSCGDQIPIEQRSPEEVTHVFGVPVTPEGVGVENPAFDITPHRYVTAIITERGIARPPYTESLLQLCRPMKNL